MPPLPSIGRTATTTPASPVSGLSTLIKDHLAGGASRLAALLLPQILPVFSVVAPCHPGAALRDLVLVQCGQATRGNLLRRRRQLRDTRNANGCVESTRRLAEKW